MCSEVGLLQWKRPGGHRPKGRSLNQLFLRQNNAAAYPDQVTSRSVNIRLLIRNSLGDRVVRRIKSVRTRASSKLELGPWRRPGLNGLDVQLAEAIGWTSNGTFIELGGNDGLQASNSFLLENELGWRGILIEAIPELAAEAQRNRPQATVVCGAASSSPQTAIIGMAYQDLISKVTSSDHDVKVCTTTLSTVIDEVAHGEAPTLLSIDVEGYELEVIGGLDLTRHRPKWILVETDQPSEVQSVLSSYELVSKLSFHDYLFELT
jgi:FkbM family methyltransferase